METIILGYYGTIVRSHSFALPELLGFVDFAVVRFMKLFLHALRAETCMELPKLMPLVSTCTASLPEWVELIGRFGFYLDPQSM